MHITIYTYAICCMLFVAQCIIPQSREKLKYRLKIVRCVSLSGNLLLHDLSGP